MLPAQCRACRRIAIVSTPPNYYQLVRRDVFPLLEGPLGRLLDVGGGVGATSAALRREGRASYAMLLDRVADGAADGVDDALAGNLEDPAFLGRAIAKGGLFDTIICLDVLEHLHDPWAVVAALHRGLVPGGTLVVSVPNVNYIGLVGPLVLRGRFDLTDAGVMDRTHLRWFARHGAIDLATGSGLVLERVQANVYGRFKRALDAVTLGLLTRFLAVQYVVRARRPA
jgi:2-polyprenyl-3-methyl-5-hydroxy-6-metoxy-1,4-benzoquinol methylase